VGRAVSRANSQSVSTCPPAEVHTHRVVYRTLRLEKREGCCGVTGHAPRPALKAALAPRYDFVFHDNLELIRLFPGHVRVRLGPEQGLS
jgi:hypothetical protein